MADPIKLLAALCSLLILPSAAALAANAIATRPMSIYASPSTEAKVIGLIGKSQTITAKNCRKGWCAAQGGYVRSELLQFSRAAAEEGYDYNVPLALPPYGYTPGFWGYGGKRYYDDFGNYAKYGQQGYAGPPSAFDTGPVETRRRGLFGPR
jgi:hypothetical protein